MRKTANFLNRFWDDQCGAAAAEYVIILASIGAALTFAMLLLSDAVATSINDTATCIDTRGVTCN